MSTQYSNDIAFSASHSQQAFKLLELPAELLSLLESGNPPKYISSRVTCIHLLTLSLSRITIKPSASTATTPEYATLCYGDKKYQMRQKNSSNPILILRPSTTAPAEDDNAENFIPQPSITVISKIDDTIELILLEDQPNTAPKVNKWHEKFAKTRAPKKD